MSLHQYEVDFSQLALDERTVLMDRIEKCLSTVFTGSPVFSLLSSLLMKTLTLVF